VANRRAAALLVVVCLLGGCRWDGDDGRDRNPENQPYYVRQPRPDDATRPDPERAPHKVRGPAFSGDQATFQLINGSDAVKVSVADLGGAMFEVSTAESAKSAPAVRVDGSSVVTGLRGTGRAGPAFVQVVLSDDLRWSVQLVGGAVDQVVDLTGGPGGDVDFSAGTSRAEAALPVGRGTQRVTMRGGTKQFVVRLAGTAPARVTATGGAGSVTIDGETHNGVSGNAVWTPDNWAAAQDRFDITAAAGVSTMTVEHK
jgi:hypothetical protein